MATRLNDSQYGAAYRIFAALCFLILSSIAVSVLLGLGESTQLFAASGQAKKFLLPLVYLTFAVVAVWPYEGHLLGVAKPIWWSSLILIVTTSTILSVYLQRQDVHVSDLMEGFALAIGWTLIAWAGLNAGHWPAVLQRRLLYILGATAFLSLLLSLPLGIFVSFHVPVAASLLYAAIRADKGKAIFLMLGAITSASVGYSAFYEKTASSSTLMQVGICFGLLLVALAPPLWRGGVAIVIGTIAVYWLAASSVFQLMVGSIPPGEEDVTLVHRAYEAQTVETLVQEGIWSLLFGVGPAATVDLSNSPDRDTLAAAGRTVTAVDDVHFLTSWILLKFGFAGIVWLFFLIVAVIREACYLLASRRPRVFEVVLLIFVVGGIVSALPAATNFFTNPLVPLFLGIITARRRATVVPRQPSQMMPFAGPSHMGVGRGLPPGLA